MTRSPLELAAAFWKPFISEPDLDALAAFCEPGEPRLRGLNALRAGSEPSAYELRWAGGSVRIFASVHPVGDVPPDATVVAEIVGPSGGRHSCVLWFPEEGALVVPFDPNQAIDSFRHEDYVPMKRRTALPKPVLAFYYAVAKPLMPRALKHRLRRALARRAMAAPDSLSWPTDESLDALMRFLLRMIMLASGRDELEFAWFWPDRHPWAATLTHDVETADGLARVPHVMELERARGVRSSFNLVAIDYDVGDELLDAIHAEGFEAGVHGYTHDGLLFSSRPVFEERKGTINEFGRRIHAAGFRSPATYRDRGLMQELEFDYDSSFSNTAPCEPQPGGCGSFFPYVMGDLIEVPITLPQDHTLFELLGEGDAGTWMKALATIESAHGMACVLAHPDPAPGYIGMPANEAHYFRVVDAVTRGGAWVALPREIARWWRRRAETPVSEFVALEEASLGCASVDASGAVVITPPAR